MKIVIEHYDCMVTIENESDELDSDEVAEKMARAMIATGFHPDNVYQSFYKTGHEYLELGED